jgi:Gpi18-like mannosyltransferase
MESANKLFDNKTLLIIIGSLVLLARILINIFPSIHFDFAGYLAWSTHLATKGIDDFYDTWHVVYAPFYPLILLISGKLASLFSFNSQIHGFIIKSWTLLFEVMGAVVIYLIGKQLQKPKMGFWLGIAYLLNPVIIFNSSIWGQFDTIVATLLILIVYLFMVELDIIAVITFMLVILVKPQGIILLPLVVTVFFKRFTWDKLIASAIGCFAIYIAVTLPFAGGRPFYWLAEHFLTKGGDYPYVTANAYNTWILLWGQTIPDSQSFLFLPYGIWGLLFIAATSVLSIWIILKHKLSAFSLCFAGFFLSLVVFMLGTRMHERYLIPALIFATICILWDKKFWIILGIFSLMIMGNLVHIYSLHLKSIHWISNGNIFAIIIALISTLATGYVIFYLVQNFLNKKELISK